MSEENCMHIFVFFFTNKSSASDCS